MTSVRVVSPDLERLRRAVAGLDADLSREVTATLKQAAEEVMLPAARRAAPVGSPGDYANRARPAPGRTRDSLRVLASRKRAAIAAGWARLEYVPVIYYGWPGHNIEANPWLEDVIDGSSRSRFLRAVERDVDVTFRRHIGGA